MRLKSSLFIKDSNGILSMQSTVYSRRDCRNLQTMCRVSESKGFRQICFCCSFGWDWISGGFSKNASQSILFDIIHYKLFTVLFKTLKNLAQSQMRKLEDSTLPLRSLFGNLCNRFDVLFIFSFNHVILNKYTFITHNIKRFS